MRHCNCGEVDRLCGERAKPAGGSRMQLFVTGLPICVPWNTIWPFTTHFTNHYRLYIPVPLFTFQTHLPTHPYIPLGKVAHGIPSIEQ